MTAPANIRVNAMVNFPSLVFGTGPVTVTKANGIFSIGFSITPFASQNPLVGSFPTDFLLGYDTVAQQFYKISLTNLIASLNAASGIRTQRSVIASPIAVAGTDMILNVNINAGAPTCALPAAATRNGLPVTFKDIGAQFAAHNLTITPNGIETIDGAATLVLAVNRQAVTLVPFNDGTNSGWAIE